jgi:hypothetical protein
MRRLDRRRWLAVMGGQGKKRDLFRDTFNRADGAVANDWTEAIGTWSIASNTVLPAESADGHNILYRDIGIANVTIETETITPAVGTVAAGIVFNYNDANSYWMFVANKSANLWQLVERVSSSSFPTRASLSGAGYTWNGSTFKMRAVVNGDNVKCYVNDVLVIDYTAVGRIHKTKTVHGLRVYKKVGDATYSDGGSKFDYITVNP